VSFGSRRWFRIRAFIDGIRRYLYMTGDEKIPSDFDQTDSMRRGVEASVDENAGPHHSHLHPSHHEFAEKAV